MAPLIIRVDADARIGHGHLTRCLALAGGWPGPVIVAAARACPDTVAARIAAAGGTHVSIAGEPGSDLDARATAALARTSGAEWVVVDGYQFGAAYQRTLTAAGLHVLCIDDNGEAGSYVCDLVLNQNLHASEALYATRAQTTGLLLGPRFVLLRQAFLDCGRQPRGVEAIARRLLVTLGGGDAGPALLTVLDALGALALPDLRVTVIAGAQGAVDPEVHARASRIRGAVTLLEHSDAMAPLMAEADLAISAGGSTSWELAYMGLPAAVITMAPNQAGAVGALLRHGLAADLGPRERLDALSAAGVIDALARDPGRRARMSAAGQALIDGCGVARAVEAMRQFSPPPTQAPAGAGQMKDTQ